MARATRTDRGEGRNGNGGVRDPQKTVTLSDGDDTFIVKGGSYKVFGGEGYDFLSTGLGRDMLFGEEGNDVLISSGGNDTQDGGAGDDIHIFGEWAISSTERQDTVTQIGGDGDDFLYINDAFVARMYGGDGNDTFHSWSVNTTAYGGAGNDNIAIAGGRAFGGLGADVFRPLNDWVHGDKIHLTLLDFEKSDKIDFSWLSKYDEELGYYRQVQESDATYDDGIIQIEGVGTIEADLGKGVDDMHDAVLVGIANFQPEDGGKG